MTTRSLLALCAALALCGCNADENPAVDGGDTGADALDTGGTDGTDGTEVPADTAAEYDVVDIDDDLDCYQDIDIVFVLDVSTSMSWVLERLRDEILAVWEYATGLSTHVDYEPRFGLVVFVDDVLVTNSGLPYDAAGDLQVEFESWRSFCSGNAQPGGSSCSNGDCPENTLDALAAAAEQYAWREGALHVAILATDDTFKESPASLCSSLLPTIPVEHTYAETISLLVANEIRVGTFAAHSSPACPMPANKEPGFFAPWDGQASIPDATGSMVWDLHDVQSGTISLTEAIAGFVLEEWCTEFI